MKAFFIVLAVLASVGSALAQGLPGRSAAEPDTQAATAEALSALEAAGNTVIVLPAGGDMMAAPEPTPATSLAEEISAVRVALGPIFADAPSLPAQMGEALMEAGDGSVGWLIPAAILLAASVLIGTAAFQLTSRAVTRLATAIGTAPPETRAGKIGRSLGVLIRGWLATTAFFAVGALVVLFVEPALSPERVTALMALGSAATYLLVRCVMTSVLAPRNAPIRLAPFDDKLAMGVFSAFLTAFFWSNIVTWVCFWFGYFPLPRTGHQLLLMGAATLSMVVLVAVTLRYRKRLTTVIRGTHPRPAAFRRVAVALWLVAAIVYLIVAWITTVAVIAIDSRLALGPVLAPVFGLVAAMVANGILLIILDRRLMPIIVNPEWADLYERIAFGVSVIVWAVTVGLVWRVFSGPYEAIALNAVGLAFTVLAAWGGWQAVRVWVNARLEEEMPDAAQDGEGEGFGPGASRLATLLPIFRNVMFFLIISVLLMVGLSSLGVDVAPLFAGAGVVGLAIGFGAQALIRDVFSGAFFLFDDAFRRGEYVEVGGVAGQVEKISVRSFQLRHHEGALHTLPFGEIKQLTNFSRDWVIMKLPMRITYDTDVEKVRKMVKKLGLEMAADPEIGHLFLEAPKSQGVVQMEDSAMIMRIKFKTRPGDQFVVRRHVFQRVRDLFDREGIRFTHKEFTVRVTGTDDEDIKRRAATGAARAEVEAAPAAGASDYAGAAG
ncbi:MAG: mechanosensitive ion channel domain-containing protein [Pseudomonadota bacterium]